MDVVTPTDRPKSLRNSCVIELFLALFVLSLCPFEISVGVRAFVVGLSQISSFFSYLNKRNHPIRFFYLTVFLWYKGENFYISGPTFHECLRLRISLLSLRNQKSSLYFLLRFIPCGYIRKQRLIPLAHSVFMFDDTSRYLHDILTIDNREFEKHIPDQYPTELQLTKANTLDKETSFLELNIKVIGSGVHTSIYNKRNDFGFPIVSFPWLSGDVPRLPKNGVYISQ